MYRKKLLIAGGGYADIPLIKAAKNLGFYVITSGNRPDELGHEFSDQYCQEDFSNKEAMLALAKTQKIDAICAACNDFSAISCAYVAEEMGLPGHDNYQTALTIHHKDKYRSFARTHNIPSPLAEGFSSVKDAVNSLAKFTFPVIIKPVDLTGGKGVTTVYTKENAKFALEYAFSLTKASRIIVEEFVQGSRHGLSTFIRDGKVAFYFGDNEHYYLNQYLVSGASTPSSISDTELRKVCDIAEKIASLLKLKTGIFHIQYILSSKGPTIIEICRRAPGDLYIQFVSMATGVNYPEYIVKASAGMDCTTIRQKPLQGFFTRHCVMASENGIIDSVSFDKSIEDTIVDKMMWWKPSYKIENYLSEKCGIVFLKFESQEKMLKTTKNLPHLIQIKMQ